MFYTSPNPELSIRAPSITLSKSSESLKWIGKVMPESQLEDVGRHLHPGAHPCLNLMVTIFSKPSGVTLCAPVINWYNFDRLLLESMLIETENVRNLFVYRL
jgi:hypothetical protein